MLLKALSCEEFSIEELSSTEELLSSTELLSTEDESSIEELSTKEELSVKEELVARGRELLSAEEEWLLEEDEEELFTPALHAPKKAVQARRRAKAPILMCFIG